MVLTTSFIVAPAPEGPTCSTVAPIASSTGRARSTADASPPAIEAPEGEIASPPVGRHRPTHPAKTDETYGHPGRPVAIHGHVATPVLVLVGDDQLLGWEESDDLAALARHHDLLLDPSRRVPVRP